MFLFIWIFTVSVCTLGIQAEGCQSRDYGNGGTVCVCTSEYCDTISKPEKVEQPKYIKYTSNKAGLRFEKETGEFKKSDVLDENEIIINTGDEYQQILGWGGAFTDSTGINIKSLDQQAQDNLLLSYFSENGLEYSLCRVPIGGTDFSTHGYSYNDGSEDTALKNFNLTEEDFNFKIPYIKTAQKMSNNTLQLFASAWTAPKWMKTNSDYAGLGFLINKYYQTWADYFVKFLDKYAENEINFWGITTGNEPSLGYIPFGKINSVGWLPGQMKTWITNNLGPTLEKSKYSEIKIMAIDDQRFFLPGYANLILDNNVTKQYVDGIAVHWYWNKLFPASLLSDTHNNFPDKFILATEACNGDKSGDVHVILGSWERGESYANDIIEDVTNWVGGWVDWNMALDLQGGPTYIENYVDSPIIVNASANEFYKQPTFYNLGHFSKFIPRKSVRIGAVGFSKDIPVAAFKRPDNGIVLVILNKQEEVVPVTIIDDSRGIVKLTLSEKSINTIIYW